MRDQAVPRIDDPPSEALLVAVDPFQNERSSKKLKRATKGEALVTAMRDQPGARGIKNRDAKAAPMPPFENGDLLLQPSGRSTGGSRQHQPSRGEQRTNQQLSA